MSKRQNKNPENQSGIILYQAEDGLTKVEVRLENETVWLTQGQIATLFQTTKQNVSLHIKTIYDEGELAEGATVKKYLTVQTEGNRKVSRQLDYYNLEMIIAVGYRVKSAIATKFSPMGDSSFERVCRQGFYDGRRTVKGWGWICRLLR